MPLVPPINLAQFNLQPEPATFGPLWDQFFSEVDTLDTPDLVAAGVLTAVDLAAIASAIDTPLTIASLSLDGELGLADPPDMAKALGNMTKADSGFTDVLSVTPREAFMAFPPDLLPPPELGGFTVSIPTSGPGSTAGFGAGGPPLGYPGGGYPGGGGGGQPGPRVPEVRLTNESRPGANSFNVGDVFLLEIIGDPGGAVQVSSTFNGRGSPLVRMGNLGSTGYLAIRGSESQTDRGEWYESWYVNGVLAGPVLHFFVN